MDIEFFCLREGIRYHRVLRQGRELFVGTRRECERYCTAHAEKVRAEQAAANRAFRLPPVLIRTYRDARARA